MSLLSILLLVVWFLVSRLYYKKLESTLLSTKTDRPSVICSFEGDSEELRWVCDRVYEYETTRLPTAMYVTLDEGQFLHSVSFMNLF